MIGEIIAQRRVGQSRAQSDGRARRRAVEAARTSQSSVSLIPRRRGGRRRTKARGEDMIVDRQIWRPSVGAGSTRRARSPSPASTAGWSRPRRSPSISASACPTGSACSGCRSARRSPATRRRRLQDDDAGRRAVHDDLQLARQRPARHLHDRHRGARPVGGAVRRLAGARGPAQGRVWSRLSAGAAAS